MRKMSFLNKERNKSNLETLTKALTNRDKSVINTGTVVAPQSSSNDDNILGGAGDLLTGGMKLYGGLKNSGLFGGDAGIYNGEAELGGWLKNNPIGNAANDYVMNKPDYGTIGNAANESIMGTAGSGSAVGDAIGAEVGSGTSGGFGGGGAPWRMIANAGKGLYNNITGKTPSKYSDVEQSTIYPLQGAANGFSLGGPWGALGGALYGLGYSFKDDLGLDDSNFLTQMLFPIGMGDGGGLRISGEPILDIL